MTPEEIEREIRMKQLANREELEKVKARRQEREAEKAAREEEMSAEQRSKEAQQFQEWQKHEDQFHLEQARLRSKIRIQVLDNLYLTYCFVYTHRFLYDRTVELSLSTYWLSTSILNITLIQ